MTTAKPLDAYHAKRDFGATREPSGADAAATSDGALSFVIQKHAARNLHYDFRLEVGGTLRSWAVPKGPSLDPAVKRMAVQVEDHPLDYAAFESTIPEGHYGAGTVIVWDRGTWQPVGDANAGLRAGRLKFDLHGEKLAGRWALVRMKPRAGERQPAWLLMKKKDAHARPADGYDVTEALPNSVLSPPDGAPPQRAPAGAAPVAKKAPATVAGLCEEEADADAGDEEARVRCSDVVMTLRFPTRIPGPSDSRSPPPAAPWLHRRDVRHAGFAYGTHEIRGDPTHRNFLGSGHHVLRSVRHLFHRRQAWRCVAGRRGSARRMRDVPAGLVGPVDRVV